jgi:uncharacterized membrane protein
MEPHSVGVAFLPSKNHDRKRGDAMKRHAVAVLFAVLACCAGSLAAQAEQPASTYRLTHLGTQLHETGEATGFFASDINDKGEMSGLRPTPEGGTVAAIWRAGDVLDLLPSPLFGAALGINDRSDVVAAFQDEQFVNRSILWRRGRITPITAVPGELAAEAYAINNRRQVLLRSIQQTQVQQFIWQEGRLTLLEPLPDSDSEFANGINDRGVAVGSAFTPGFTQIAVVWENGTVMQLGLPDGATSAGADDINNRGVIAGTAFFPGIPLPGRNAGFVWRDGEFTLLGSPGDQYKNTAVFAINNRGVVVGQSFTPAPATAVVATLWRRNGRAVDINQLVANDDPLKPFVHLNFARLINDRGQIVADGVDSRNAFSSSQYLLTPRR